MSKAQTEEQLAVECGYWNNFRFNPGAEGDKFFLDSKEPKKEDYQAFLDGEVRYNALKRANPEKAEKLFAINEQEAMERYAYLQKTCRCVQSRRVKYTQDKRRLKGS